MAWLISHANLEFHVKYKNIVEFESYLHNIINNNSRIQFTIFRLSANNW